MDVKKAIETRRAYRSLDPVPIDRDLIEDLARCAILAPSCFNNQPARFDFVTGDRLVKMREALSRGNRWAHDASMIIAVHAALENDCRVEERQYYLFDAGLATAMLILRATELGLVAHPIAGYDEGAVRETLGIPEADRVITLVIVGRHADTIRESLSQKQAAAEPERPGRLSFEEFARIFD
ncbi:MAG: nitroreductase family protein [Candidatus Krumholzibacteria bacterium]|nr:nitroreductase family protein [Candidatus Krumholzibacteria bacterium]